MVADELACATLTLIQKITSSAFDFKPNGHDDAGVDYLSTKLELLVSYCINLSFYLLAKIEGINTADHPVIDQMLLIQGVLERLKPLDGRMKTELDRLIRLVQLDHSSSDASGQVNIIEQSNIGLGPRIGNFVVDEENGGDYDKEDGEDDNNIRMQDDTALYQPPKLSATPFEDEQASLKEERRLERMRHRLRQSETLRGVRSELLGTPEEVTGGSSGVAGLDEDSRSRILAQEKEKVEWEEEHMMRRAVTKKEKFERKQLLTQATRLDTIADVGEMAMVWGSGKKKTDDRDDGYLSHMGSGKSKKKRRR